MPSMGKQAKLKAQGSASNSPESLAKFYLKANELEAQSFRNNLALQYIGLATTGPDFTPMIDQLSVLPIKFLASYLNLLGHVIVGARHRDFWEKIAKDLLTITAGPENETALKQWGKEESFFYSSVDIAKGWCYTSLQKLADSDAPTRMLMMREELKYNLNNFFFDAIPTHLVACSAVVQQKVLKQSGSLVLFYQKFSHETIERELWLVKKRFDGIYTISTEAKDGSLKVSDVRNMRKFVSQYDGPLIKGTLSPGREAQAARICSSVGLQTDGRKAWIGGSK
jgi:hypothetical protein